MTHPEAQSVSEHQSPFAGQQMHQLIGFSMISSATPPLFDDDVWDFRGLIGNPVQLKPSELLFNFSLIANPAWRMVAKEIVTAMLCPRHPALLELPTVRRSPLHLRTSHQRLFGLTKWFDWLTRERITSLSMVTQMHCDRYLHQRRDDGISAAMLMHAVTSTKEVARYGKLLTADRYRPGFVPWQGRNAATVAAFSPRGENKTPAVADPLLGPIVLAGHYLVTVLGPHVPELLAAIDQDRTRPVISRHVRRDEFADLMNSYVAQHEALPQIDDYYVPSRLERGWHADDPLLRVSFRTLCNQLGLRQCYDEDLPVIRDLAEEAVAEVGTLPRWVRTAPKVPTADGTQSVPWSQPMTSRQVARLAAAVGDACLVLTAAVSGMRSSELMELTTAAAQPPREITPGMFRFTLSGKRIKNEQWGGVQDEWVVIEPAYRAVELALRLRHRGGGRKRRRSDIRPVLVREAIRHVSTMGQ